MTEGLIKAKHVTNFYLGSGTDNKDNNTKDSTDSSSKDTKPVSDSFKDTVANNDNSSKEDATKKDIFLMEVA